MGTLDISDNELLTGARIGIPKSKLLSIAHETGLTLKELSSYLRISTRSIQVKEASQFIPPEPSERALFIARLFKSGNDLFGNRNKFHNWLNMENLAMGGEKPVSYLDTFSGIQLVMDELNSIEYGFPQPDDCLQDFKKKEHWANIKICPMFFFITYLQFPKQLPFLHSGCQPPFL